MKTEINIYVVLVILFTHWIADFVCQTDKMAQGKSKNLSDLFDHTITYSLIFSLIGILFLSNPFLKNFNIFPLYNVCLFSIITFTCHIIQDYITSRINSRLWADKKVHWFFVSIGFDQFLHFAQLIITYNYLIQ